MRLPCPVPRLVGPHALARIEGWTRAGIADSHLRCHPCLPVKVHRTPGRRFDDEALAMAASVDTVEVELALITSPRRTPMLAASAPNIEPFERIDPTTDDLWIRLGATEQHFRAEFMTRRSTYEQDGSPRPIARSTSFVGDAVRVSTVLGIQMVVDLLVVRAPSPGEVHTKPVHLVAFIEPPSYDWDRYRTLYTLFAAEQRRSRRARGGTVPGRLPGRESTRCSPTRRSDAASPRRRSTPGAKSIGPD